MALAAQLVAIAEAKQPWFWASASVVALALLVANVLIVLAVHVRRLREGVRRRRAKRARARVEEILAELDPSAGTRDLMVVACWSLLELFWYPPVTAIWRSWATVQSLTGRRPGCGSISRGVALREEPEAGEELVPAPLPR